MTSTACTGTAGSSGSCRTVARRRPQGLGDGVHEQVAADERAFPRLADRLVRRSAAPHAAGYGYPLLFVDRIEEFEEFLSGPGGYQFVDLVGIREEDGDAAKDVHVAALVSGDTHGEPDLVAVPVNRWVVADHGERGALYRALRLVGAVRDGQVVAHVGRHRLLPFEHRVDVVRGDCAGVDEDSTGFSDGLVLASGRARHLHLGQAQDITHTRDSYEGFGRFGTIGAEWRAGRRTGLCPPRLLRTQAQLGALLSWGVLVRFNSSTMASYFGLLMKLSTETCWALGVRSLARGVRSWWVTTRSMSSDRFAIATLTTLTSSKPAFFTLLRRMEAPMALDPMPASQAKTMLWIGPRWEAASCSSSLASASCSRPVSMPETALFLPFMASMDAVAAARSPSPR